MHIRMYFSMAQCVLVLLITAFVPAFWGAPATVAVAQESCCDLFQANLLRSDCGDKFEGCCFELVFESLSIPPPGMNCGPTYAKVELLSGGNISTVYPYKDYSIFVNNNTVEFTYSGPPGETATDAGIICFEGTGPFAVRISYEISDFNAGVSLECPPRELTVNCCDEGCLTNSVDMSTGVADWMVIYSVNGGTVPRAADVLTTINPSWAPAMPGTSWIAPHPWHSNPTIGQTIFEYCFCLCEETEVTLNFDHRADDNMSASLDGNPIGSSSVAHAYATLPADNINHTEVLSAGRHCITVIVENNPALSMGLNISGAITTPNNSLLVEPCCTADFAGMPAPDEDPADSPVLQTGKFEAENRSSLLQGFKAFPNPTVKNTTTIRYELSSQANIELQVFNAMGRKVQTLDQGMRSAGVQTLEFTTEALEAGTYFIRLGVNAVYQSIVLGVAH